MTSRSCFGKMNSTLGSVVPLEMFPYFIKYYFFSFAGMQIVCTIFLTYTIPPKHVSFFLSFVSSCNEFPAGMEGRSRDPDLFMAKQAAINYIFSETKHTLGDTFILLLASR